MYTGTSREPSGVGELISVHGIAPIQSARCSQPIRDNYHIRKVLFSTTRDQSPTAFDRGQRGVSLGLQS
jgi:hypothetical protein